MFAGAVGYLAASLGGTGGTRGMGFYKKSNTYSIYTYESKYTKNIETGYFPCPLCPLTGREKSNF